MLTFHGPILELTAYIKLLWSQIDMFISLLNTEYARSKGQGARFSRTLLRKTKRMKVYILQQHSKNALGLPNEIGGRVSNTAA